MRNLLMMISLLLLSLPLSAQSAPPPMQSPQSHAKPGETTVIPEGTHLLMQLLSPLDTESAVKGSELYLETIFPVVREDHVSIPIHTRVQGSVEAEKRAGHFDRTAKFRMHFTTLVLANGYTVPIQGVLQGLPGSTSARVQDAEGSVSRVDQGDRALLPIGGGVLAGAILGSVRNFGTGTLHGAALGAMAGTGAVLITRGDSIHLPEGAKVEIVLAVPVSIPSQVIADAIAAGSKEAPSQAAPAPKAQTLTPSPSTPMRRTGPDPLTGIIAEEISRAVVK